MYSEFPIVIRGAAWISDASSYLAATLRERSSAMHLAPGPLEATARANEQHVAASASPPQPTAPSYTALYSAHNFLVRIERRVSLEFLKTSRCFGTGLERKPRSSYEREKRGDLCSSDQLPIIDSSEV